MSVLDHPQVEGSMELFLERVRPRLKVIFLRFRIPPDDAEDLLQQALLAFCRHSGEVRDPSSWLAGILRHKCLLYWRERRRKVYEVVDNTLLDAIAKPQEPTQHQAELRHDMKSVIERLPRRCRELLRMRYGLGYEAPEMAEVLGYRPSSIGKITTRCLAALMRLVTAAGLGEKRHAS